MHTNKLLLPAASILAIVGLTASEAAPITLRTTGSTQIAPLARASSAPKIVRGPELQPTYTAGCSGSGSRSFVGAGNNNSAAGNASGIVSGDSNDTCSSDTSVAAGSGNKVGGSDNGYSYDASIVSGITNAITGSAAAFIGAGINNVIANPPNGTYYNSNNSAIGAGIGNTVETPQSFIGAGFYNSILSPSVALNSYSPNSFIGAGYGNTVDADFSLIGGGFTNSTYGEQSAIVGGYSNAITSSGNESFIGGGYTNKVSGPYSGIAAGYGNVASGTVATIAGGYENSASGRNSSIPGGAYNVAGGPGAFAAGYRSNAGQAGTFVWNNDDGSSLVSTAPNQFLARASGGFYLYSSPGTSAGVYLAPGSGAWSTLSDRGAKTDIRSVDDQRILAKIASMPVSEWSYTAQGTSVRHVGPMAQDFRAAFGLGEDDRHISTVDEEGVALAAIKALQQALLSEEIAKNGEIAKLRADKDRQIANLRSADDAKFSALEKRLAALESR